VPNDAQAFLNAAENPDKSGPAVGSQGDDLRRKLASNDVVEADDFQDGAETRRAAPSRRLELPNPSDPGRSRPSAATAASAVLVASQQ
jgi:hypothetical protein